VEILAETALGYEMTSGRNPKDEWSIVGGGIYVQHSRTYQPPVASASFTWVSGEKWN
jgi:hypothetical protein